MRGEEQAVRQTGQLIVVGEVIEVLLLLEQLRFDLATDQTAVLSLIDELAMTRFGIEHLRPQVAPAPRQRDGPGTDCEQRNRTENGEQCEHGRSLLWSCASVPDTATGTAAVATQFPQQNQTNPEATAKNKNHARLI